MSALQKMPQIPIQRLARFLSVIAIAMAAGHLVQTLAARKPAAKVMAAVSTPQDIVQLSAASAPDPVVAAPVIVKPAEVILVANADPWSRPLSKRRPPFRSLPTPARSTWHWTPIPRR